MQGAALCVRFFLLPVLLAASSGCKAQEPVRVLTGAEVLLAQRLDLLRGKNVGLITNQTGVLPDGRPIYSVLAGNGIHVAALFSPEHGFRGIAEAGVKTGDTVDSISGIPVYSLYGTTRKPTPDMLKGIDLLLYDLQDVGVRFYTYISTMGLAMEAAGELGIPFIVLDRPDPQGGGRIEGPIMEDSLRSFIGLFPIPVVYGLTCGELALMIAGEGWLRNGVRPDVQVIQMSGWSRGMDWQATGLPWRIPSPNIPTAETALIYPATCFLEATQISEGRGTKEPFMLLGAPFVDSLALRNALTAAAPGSVGISPAAFAPESSKHKGLICQGVRLHVTEPASFRAVETGLALLKTLHDLYPQETGIRRDGLERLLGSRRLVDALLSGRPLSDLIAISDEGLDAFRAKRSRYLLYH